MFKSKNLDSGCEKVIPVAHSRHWKNVFKSIKLNVTWRLRSRKSLIVSLFVLLVCIVCFFYWFYYVMRADMSIDRASASVIKSISNLDKDNNWMVNMLLIWAWWGVHDGPELTDTMIVASFDLERGDVVMLSIPRDFYMVYNKQYSGSRINEIVRDMSARFVVLGLTPESARDQAREMLVSKIWELVWLKINYFVQIDFDGFKHIVDALWWIQVDVKEAIIDDTYPDSNWWYETFSVPKWVQTMSWEIALKYARSRHTTSDFDRARRQQEIIDAIKHKAGELHLLSSPIKIKKLYDIWKEYVETNLGFSQILWLAYNFRNISSDKIYKAVLNDDWTKEWGFLGTPPRVDYWWAFVLIPVAGEANYSDIKFYSNIIFNERRKNDFKIDIFNWTKISWMATKVADRLNRFWITIASKSNYNGEATETEAIIYTKKVDVDQFKNYFEHIFPGIKLKITDKIGYFQETDTDLELIVGSNFKL